MDPEGPDVANAFGIAVFLLPLDLGGIACVIHLLNNMRKKLIAAALARQSVDLLSLSHKKTEMRLMG
jgi:hypothetical protein